jgi:hypothetical protein
MKRRKGIISILFLLTIVLMFAGCEDKEALLSETGNDEEQAGEEVVSEGFEEIEETAEETEVEETAGEETAVEDGNKDEILYISANVLNVRSDAEANASIVGKIIKGSQVAVIETVFDEDGSPAWHKIFYEHENGDYGWVSADYTVIDKMELLGPGYDDIDFSPQIKGDYESNPRITTNGIYLTAYSAGSSRVDALLELADKTRINAFVINMKDDNGSMLVETETAARLNPSANKSVPVKDIDALMKKLKEHDIYTIARIVCFVDPKYVREHPESGVVYKDSGAPLYFKNNVQWSRAYDRELWEYIVGVAKDAAEAGFNEIQFDYVRFPTSNGGKKDSYLDYKNKLGESKPLAVQNFLKYAREELDPYEVYISADVFGLVGSVGDDMGIGQYWEAISNVVDYISPMMYPSHYGPGVYGLSVPDAFPYETIYRCTKDSVMKNKNIETPAIVRPWIQDFTATYVDGHIRYGADQISAQIKGLNDNGVGGFMLWNPSNKYDAGGIEKE